MTKEEKEFNRIIKKYGEYIKGFTIFRDKGEFLYADVFLKKNYVVYVARFNEKTKVQKSVDVLNQMMIQKIDITDGAFAKGFEGFVKYDRIGKLSLLIGLGKAITSQGEQDIKIITPTKIGYFNLEQMSSVFYAYEIDSNLIYGDKPHKAYRDRGDSDYRQQGVGKVSTRRKVKSPKRMKL